MDTFTLLQLDKIHIGIKNVVNKINNMEIPSIPIKKYKLYDHNHSTYSEN